MSAPNATPDEADTGNGPFRREAIEAARKAIAADPDGFAKFHAAAVDGRPALQLLPPGAQLIKRTGKRR